MNVNDAEKRRRMLLERTKELYSDRRMPPAVHPRYGAFYSGLYREEEEYTQSTFGIRAFLCILLFVGFVMLDQQGSEVMQVDSDRIVEEIVTDTNIEEVWKNLNLM